MLARKTAHAAEEMTGPRRANALAPPSPVRLGPVEHFSASCLAGACLVALTNPLWLIKTRLQLQSAHLEQHTARPRTGARGTPRLKPAYRGIVHAARTIVHEEGALALYKGSIPALMLVSHGGIQFVTYEFLKGHFANLTENSRKSGNQWTTQQSDRGKGTIGDRLRNSLGYLVMGAASKL
jgi:solute carrier family 25 folate transporter 32